MCGTFASLAATLSDGGKIRLITSANMGSPGSVSACAERTEAPGRTNTVGIKSRRPRHPHGRARWALLTDDLRIGDDARPPLSGRVPIE